MNGIKLFCFPYAGGSATVYRKWERYLDPAITLVPVELAGRGKRIHEPLYPDVQSAIEDVFRVVSETAGQSPYALLGHSMGAMIAYELARKIQEDDLPRPRHIFLSGRGAPHLKRRQGKKYHQLNDAEFKRAVMEMGGTPPELFEYPELLELFLPLLRNDFKLSEADTSEQGIYPLDGDITVFLGKEEDLSAEQCDGWKLHTSKLCSIHYFEGGHFFLHEHTKQIAALINDILLLSKIIA